MKVNEVSLTIFRKGDNMATAIATKTTEKTYTIDDAMEVLFGKLDEAIDDMENGRVQTIEEAWEEIDSI